MGTRVVKTALSTMIAIYLAQLLSLQQSMFAGILAITGVEVTKKKSLRSAFERFLASLLSLLAAAFLFYLLGFHVWVLGLYVLIAYPLMAKAKLKDGIVTGTVIVYHLFYLRDLSLGTFWNEILVLLVGLGPATVINLLYMPDETKQLKEQKNRVEELFSRIFSEIARHLRDSEHIWDGREILEAQQAVRQGLSLARRSLENRLLKSGEEELWQAYFLLRGEQLESIQRMLNLVAQVYQTHINGSRVAELFDELSQLVKSEFYTGSVERKLLNLEQEFKVMPLPANREEFEIRSAILQLCLELKHYLATAKKLKKPRILEKDKKNFLSL